MRILKQVIYPQWPAPSQVYAAMSTRAIELGVSQAPYEHFNLGDHVQDHPDHVAHNRESWRSVLQDLRARFQQCIGCTNDLHLVYLKQVHGINLLEINSATTNSGVADACWAHAEGQVCTIMVADCLPVIFCTEDGQLVAAAHAGWRGLADGVLEQTVDYLQRQISLRDLQRDQKILAWLGPCIGPEAFEVGQDVMDAFCHHANSPIALDMFFQKNKNGRWMADLAGIARKKLERNKNILCFGNDSSLSWCTFSNSKLFFSHRRDARVLGSTGRMAVSIFRG